MHIAIDESGTFVHTDATNSWNCVVAYVYPETQRRVLQSVVENLRRQTTPPCAHEVKLRDLSEAQYVRFLRRLNEFQGIFFAVATDSATNVPELIEEHKAQQVANILANADRMIYETGRTSIIQLSNRVDALSQQLYVQMTCQVELVDRLLRHSTLYFVQRTPATLGHFRWRIDQKNTEVTEYETAYTQVLSPFMQSRSIREPMIMIEEADYSHYDRFRFPPGQEPTYLQEHYGLEFDDNRDTSLNIGQVLREDLEFVDSRADFGVQVADLLASGLRRCLRAQFADNEAIAALLGGLMVRPAQEDTPVRLVSLGATEARVPPPQSRLLLTMMNNTRGMLTR